MAYFETEVGNGTNATTYIDDCITGKPENLVPSTTTVNAGDIVWKLLAGSATIF
jgi:hypothetical protein